MEQLVYLGAKVCFQTFMTKLSHVWLKSFELVRNIFDLNKLITNSYYSFPPALVKVKHKNIIVLIIEHSYEYIKAFV